MWEGVLWVFDARYYPYWLTLCVLDELGGVLLLGLMVCVIVRLVMLTIDGVVVHDAACACWLAVLNHS